ncbi:hypothetical protein COT77_02090 [Candidatus Berkelbacteria bacterium CG10_big_fil_rev_8_21_14_0_10_41_12]|uniref:Iron-binding zinc finger CDGSH type domain-containing protein n=1 Tax=Candidatus Berkelbacteria bacterium CG10_big_fil_rev_8_21_14_0_10_41_12 TaxID=1974513 RepID=A0A2M6WX03_9BACT|nr:MAG: hypothetical protein COT77_02090 [Candidatus Berkelbacteria bacterium CG10_big_fil_rev_8_21_14_0_10_41_12]
MKIKVSKNGPYKVDDKIPLKREEIEADEEGFSCRWRKKEKLETDGNYRLCRCGQSKDKPFCDRSHIREKFKANGADEAEKYTDGAKNFEGEKYVLCDKAKLCASAKFCHRAGSAWNLVEKSDKESENILKAEVYNCPSGRLVLKNKKTGKTIEKKYQPSISITEDKPANVSGPLWVKGGIKIESPNGKIYEKRNRVTLCRCGKSKNKPFCDATHIEEGFKE